MNQIKSSSTQQSAEQKMFYTSYQKILILTNFMINILRKLICHTSNQSIYPQGWSNLWNFIILIKKIKYIQSYNQSNLIPHYRNSHSLIEKILELCVVSPPPIKILAILLTLKSAVQLAAAPFSPTHSWLPHQLLQIADFSDFAKA